MAGTHTTTDEPSLSVGRFTALRSGQFRLLMGAGMAMQLGQWIQRVALLWVVYDITGSALALASVNFLADIFVLVISPFVGPIADRVGARRLLMASALSQAAVAVVIASAVFTEHSSLTLLYVVSAGFGIGQAINNTVRNVLVYDTVGRDLLRNGLALNGLTGNTMRVIGPSAGGIIVGLRGADLAFAVQAVLLVTAVFLVAALRSQHTPVARRSSVLVELAEGFRHVKENPALRISFVITILTGALVYPYIGFMPVFVRENMGGTAIEQGWLFSGVGIGSLVGLWYVAAGRGGERSMLWSGAAYMALVGVFAQMTSFTPALICLVFAGVVHSVFSTLNQALIQLNADPAHRARALGLYSMAGGIQPFAALVLGKFIKAYGPSGPMGVACAIATIVTLILAIRSTRHARAAPAPVAA